MSSKHINANKNRNMSNNGTQEWSVKTVNCCTGCSHDCRYCYAKGNVDILISELSPFVTTIHYGSSK